MLEFGSIHAGYGNLLVLQDLDIAVPEGQITALVGANGAGKSTVCAVAAGMLAPSRGRVLLAGDDVTTLPAHARSRRGLTLTPESRGIFPGLTVEENLAVRLRPAERAKAYERFEQLASRRHVVAGHLSGGEQQILALAPVLVRPPRLLVADEPTLGLAPMIAASVLELFVEMRDLGVALLVVEEKARALVAVADHLAFMETGRLVWIDPASAMSDADLLNAYLGDASLDDAAAVPSAAPGGRP